MSNTDLELLHSSRSNFGIQNNNNNNNNNNKKKKKEEEAEKILKYKDLTI